MKTLVNSGRLCVYILGFQGFPNSIKGWGKNPPPPPHSGGVSEILLERRFYQVVGTRGGVILTIQTFFKAKATFCKY